MNNPVSTVSRNVGAMPHCETAVESLQVDCGELPARAMAARFKGSGGVTECHVTVQLTGNPPHALETLDLAWRRALSELDIDASTTVFTRFFTSDVVNHESDVRKCVHPVPGARSIIGQTPLPSSKFAMWSMHVVDPAGPLDLTVETSGCTLRRGKLAHHWGVEMTDPGDGSSYQQTHRILDHHKQWLDARGMKLAEHVVRTWWFVRNIDADYHGLVNARREHFAFHGLTRDTHYIASTGIAGAHSALKAKLSLDSYAIAGLQERQLEFVHSTDHLCPTQDYGVTFERATAVTYADRRHVFLSGTASIDASGNILHEGDVVKQLDRTLENIEALLANAGANIGDLVSLLVYLRDPADAEIIERELQERVGGVPFVLLHAPVCRPGWLIEIEGVAIVSADRPELPGF